MPGLSQLFGSREREFFDLFEEAGRNCVRAAGLLEQMLQEWPDGDSMGAITECEHEGDRITHAIIERLNKTFVTPFDREDIIAVASSLDDIVDYIEEVGDFLGLYGIEAPMEQAQRLTQMLHLSTKQIAAAIPCLRTLADIHQFTIEVNRLENESDRIYREAVASLFANDIDPMFVIRWKDIFERLENAIDSTETAINRLEGIVIKNR
jgi:predicted phosphate transport protein (TIGR00153 family)